jgi:hypothetical protein
MIWLVGFYVFTAIWFAPLDARYYRRLGYRIRPIWLAKRYAFWPIYMAHALLSISRDRS